MWYNEISNVIGLRLISTNLWIIILSLVWFSRKKRLTNFQCLWENKRDTWDIIKQNSERLKAWHIATLEVLWNLIDAGRLAWLLGRRSASRNSIFSIQITIKYISLISLCPLIVKLYKKLWYPQLRCKWT